MLANIKSVEDSLKRLQQKKSRTKDDQPVPATLSDEDKIRLQIAIDISDFCAMVRHFLLLWDARGFTRL